MSNNTVWKYTLQITDEQFVEMPRGAKVVFVGDQVDTLCVWAQVDPYEELERRRFLIVGTGFPVPEGCIFLNSVVMGDFVWHVFEGEAIRLIPITAEEIRENLESSMTVAELRSRHLVDTLEQIKGMGHYSVTLWFGEGTGCDDMDVPTGHRRCRIMGVPAGFLGEVRRVWYGTLDELNAMDLKAPPSVFSNPPGDQLTKAENSGIPGSCAWGPSIDDFMDRYAERYGE